MISCRLARWAPVVGQASSADAVEAVGGLNEVGGVFDEQPILTSWRAGAVLLQLVQGRSCGW
jgi:hypothetical protein